VQAGIRKRKNGFISIPARRSRQATGFIGQGTLAPAYFYLQHNQPVKARKPALILKSADPGNREYAWLFSALQL